MECSVDGVSLGITTNPSFMQVVSTNGKVDGAIVVSCTLRNLAGNTSTQSVTANIKNWTETLNPNTLNLKSKGGSVTLYVEGSNVSLLLPLNQHALSLVVAGGSPVALSPANVTATDDYNHNGIPDLTLKFDRGLLEASISAGIASHAIESQSTLTGSPLRRSA